MNSPSNTITGATPNNSVSETDFVEFTAYRSYLLLLARSRLSKQYGGKFDQSDIVQKTLLNAYSARAVPRKNRG